MHRAAHTGADRHAHVLNRCVDGTPAEFRTNWYTDYVQSKIKPHLLALRELANHDNDYAAQPAFMILRYCASAKFDFLLRTAPPSLIADGALAHDDLIVDYLTSILDVNNPIKKEVKYLTRKWVPTCLRENRKSIAQQEILRFADAIRLGEVSKERANESMLVGVPLGKDREELLTWAGWMPRRDSVE